MKNRNRLISHLRTSFCALVIVGALSTLPRAEAGRTSTPASGGFFPCFNYAGPPRQVGDNLIITFNLTGTHWHLRRLVRRHRDASSSSRRFHKIARQFSFDRSNKQYILAR